ARDFEHPEPLPTRRSSELAPSAERSEAGRAQRRVGEPSGVGGPDHGGLRGHINTLSGHDGPCGHPSTGWSVAVQVRVTIRCRTRDRKSTRLNSSHVKISYA